MSVLLVSLDNTIVNVALPDIGAALHTSVQSLQWIVGGYVLVIGSFLLLAGSLADRYGRKRVFLVGILVFTVGSALSGLAPDELSLIASRLLQGIGGSMMTPVALAIISSVYVTEAGRARAIGWWGAVSGIGIALGPLLGGLLVDTFGWRSVFWINVPLGVVAAGLTAWRIPESTAASPRRLDPVGQILVVVALASLAFGVIELPSLGVAAPTAGASVAAAVSLAALVWWERRHPEPLVDLRLFADRAFAVAFVTSLVAYAAFAGLLFTNTFYLQDVRALTASAAGALTLPLAAVVIVASPLSGRLVGRGRARFTLILGGAAMTVAAVLLAALVSAPVWLIVVPLLVFGAGYGLLNDPINVTAVSELPEEQAGVAASIMSAAKQVGQLIGVSVIGAVVATAPSHSTAAQFAPTYLLTCALLGAAGVAVAAVNATGRDARRMTQEPRGSAAGASRDHNRTSRERT